MKVKRHFHTGVRIGDVVYAFGGYLIKSFEKYSVIEDGWTAMSPDLPLSAKEPKRFSAETFSG
jgi:hypothetical protein